MTDTERIDWLEEQARKGACIDIIREDDDHWAVSGIGIQTCSTGRDPQDIDTTFFAFKKDWHPTIREAIDAAMVEVKPCPE